LFEALLTVSDWVRIHYLWRPNLPDEADNHILELAVAAGAEALVTANVRDFGRAELLFPNVRVATPGDLFMWRRGR
jgi:predicted nucleic acid-binding protein